MPSVVFLKYLEITGESVDSKGKFVYATCDGVCFRFAGRTYGRFVLFCAALREGVATRCFILPNGVFLPEIQGPLALLQFEHEEEKTYQLHTVAGKAQRNGVADAS